MPRAKDSRPTSVLMGTSFEAIRAVRVDDRVVAIEFEAKHGCGVGTAAFAPSLAFNRQSAIDELRRQIGSGHPAGWPAYPDMSWAAFVAAAIAEADAAGGGIHV